MLILNKIWIDKNFFAPCLHGQQPLSSQLHSLWRGIHYGKFEQWKSGARPHGGCDPFHQIQSSDFAQVRLEKRVEEGPQTSKNYFPKYFKTGK